MCLTIYFKNSIAKCEIIEQIVFLLRFIWLSRVLTLFRVGESFKQPLFEGVEGGGGWKVLIFDVINGDKGRKSEKKTKIGAQFDYLEFSQPTRIRKD